MNGLRVVCDLSDFFHDFRKRTIMYIDFSKDRFIEDIITRIQKQFLANENKIVLLVGECFLPCSEDIRILRDGDIIKVTKDVQTNIETIFSTQKSSEADLRNIYASETSEGITLNHQELVGDLRKLDSCTDSNSLMNISESNGLNTDESEKKQTLFNNQSSKPTEIIPGKDFTQTVPVLEVHNLVHSVQELDHLGEAEKSNTDSSVIVNGSHSTDNDLETRKKGKKRTRIRKHKKKQNSEDPQPQTPSLLRPAYMNKDTIRSPFSTSTQPNPNHIIFSNEIQTSDDDFNNDNNISDVCGRTTRNNFDSLTVPSKPANTQWDVLSTAKIDNFSSYGYNNQPFDKILALGNATPIVAKRKRPEKVFADNSVPVAASTLLLNGPPKEHDVIMYKILKLDESYCPQISGHITAKVLHYTACTQQLSLEILDGIDHCRQPKGKFDLADDCDMKTDNGENFIEVNWQELLDAHKCIF